MPSISRRDFLKAAGLSAAGLVAPQAMAAVGKRRPNVVLVMTDDQGYGDLSCHGNPVLRTPHLDRLHAQSTRLTDFHVSPTCSPTRAALMTGRYCNSTGVWHTINGRSQLRRDEATLADAFAASGYRTGMFGKWHLGDNYPFRAEDRGFHEVLRHGGGGVGQRPDHPGNDYFDDTYCHNGLWKPYKGFCTDVWFDAALEFVETNRDRPFFAYIATNAPHAPYRAPERYKQMYLDKARAMKRFSKKHGPEALASFLGMIANIDDNMGRLLAKLDSLGLAQDTILIFMTDNGSSLGWTVHNAGMSGGKGSNREGGHRVPFFLRWPNRVAAGRDVDRLTAHIDVFPTLVELCRLTKPDGPRWHGVSLVPLLMGKTDGWPNRALGVDSQRVPYLLKGRRCAVMADEWRLLDPLKGKGLYKIKHDPGQQHDLAPENPDVVKRLQRDYDRWWEQSSSRGDEFTYIVIGTEHESPSHICWHDWHPTPEDLKTSAKIRHGGMGPRGWWAVEIARDGEYEFVLRPNQITEPPRLLKLAKARLRVGDVDVTQDVPNGRAAFVVFRVKLKAGKTKLRTWLIGEGQDPAQAPAAKWVYAENLELKRRRVAAGGLDYANPPTPQVAPVRPEADGSFVLSAKAATIAGAMLHYVPRRDDCGRWVDREDYLEWRLTGVKAGPYEVELECGAAIGGNAFVIEAGRATLQGKTQRTGKWEAYVRLNPGAIALPAGTVTLRLRATKTMRRALMNLKQMRLVPK